MRTIALLGFFTLLHTLPAAAQAPATQPYGLDPYNPSDAAVLRNYGSVLVADTPLLELGNLDPYNPTEAALLRQIGSGIPQCCILLGGASFGPLTPQSMRGDRAGQQPQVVVVMPSAPAAAVAAPASTTTVSGPLTTAIRPEFNDGVTVRYAGRVYTSAGRAVMFEDREFQRVGEYAGVPVYQRAQSSDSSLIFVRSRDGMVAPYRLKP